MVSLQSSHICLKKELANTFFGGVDNVFVAYNAKVGQLLITPTYNQWFVKMHQPTPFLLKNRNGEGDKTLDIRQILIDSDINDYDRSLVYEIVAKTNLLKVEL